MNERDDQIAHSGIAPKCLILRQFRNSPWTPFDASGLLCPALECAATAASPARSWTTKSTAGGPIAAGGDDVARFVAGRRSDGGGQRSQPAEQHGSEMSRWPEPEER